MTSQPISLIRGQSHTATIRIELGGASLDLATASAATFTARPSEYSPVAKITKALGAGVTAGVAGLATVALTTGDTAELDISNSYSWVLTATVSDVEHIVARGVLTAIGAPQQFVDEGVDQVARDAAAAALALAPQAAAAAVAGHDASPTAHLNIQRRTLTGNLVLTAGDLPLQRIIPDADRDVELPAEGAAQWRFEICHGGPSHTVTVKRAGGTTVASLITGAPVVVAWDGVAFGIC